MSETTTKALLVVPPCLKFPLSQIRVGEGGQEETDGELALLFLLFVFV